MAPRHGFEPRFTAPKAAVLPLDDRGKCGRRGRLIAALAPLSVTQARTKPVVIDAGRDSKTTPAALAGK